MGRFWLNRVARVRRTLPGSYFESLARMNATLSSGVLSPGLHHLDQDRLVTYGAGTTRERRRRHSDGDRRGRKLTIDASLNQEITKLRKSKQSRCFNGANPLSCLDILDINSKKLRIMYTRALYNRANEGAMFGRPNVVSVPTRRPSKNS
jgi:hypothetical protein